MENKGSVRKITILVTVACLIMAFVEVVISPVYWIKSLLKVLLFLGLPFALCIFDSSLSFKNLFKINKKSFFHALLLGIFVYAFIVGAYFLLGPYFDFSMVTKSLTNNIGVNKNNFVFVALYISFINSLLEEFFFRGFAFLSLKNVTNRSFAYIFSGLAFSLYHITMMLSWFNIFLFLLLILSLFVAGIFFNWLNEKYNNIYSSWLVHMCANFAINTIGFILFDIISI